MTTKTKTKNTPADFENAGYDPKDAQKLGEDSNFNWKAAGGGKRGAARIKLK